MTDAQNRRLFAMGMLHELIMPHTVPGKAPDFAPYATRAFAAENIRKLEAIGRTDRWRRAIRAWANAVADESVPYRWAYLQYSVYAGHAV
jgi:hypothetical protein